MKHKATVSVESAEHPYHGTYYIARVACACGWEDSVSNGDRAKARKGAADAGDTHVWMATGGLSIVARRLGRVGR